MKTLQKLTIWLSLLIGLGLNIALVHSYQDSSYTTLGHGNVKNLDRHPQDNTLLVAGNRGLWHYSEDFEVLAHYDHVSDISVAKWSNSGNFIAVRQENGNLYVFDVEQQKYIHQIEDTIPVLGIALLAWSPDDHYIAINVYDREDRIVILDVETQMPASELQLEGAIMDLFWSDDNTVLYKYLVGDFAIWNIDSQKTNELSTGLIQFGTFSMSSQTGMLAIASTTEDAIDIWNTKTEHKEMIIATKAPVWEIDWNANGNQIAFLTGNGEIIIWDIAREEELKSIDIPELPPIDSFIWDADNNLLYTVDWSADIRAWNLDKNRQEYYFQKHTTYGEMVAWQPGGNLVAIDQNYEQLKWIKLWNVDTGDVEYVLPVSNANMISNLAWSETGDMLIASFHSDQNDATPEVFVWTMGDNDPSLDFTYHSDTRFTIAVPGTPIMPVLNYEAIGDNEIVLWDLVEDTERLTIDDADNEDVLLLHDNNLAIIDEAHLSIWDLEKLELISRSDLPEDVIMSGLSQAAWNESESLFAGGICYQFGPCPVWVWDYNTSEVIFSLDEYYRGTTKFSFLNDIEWSPDNTMLATAGGEDAKVMVWTPEGDLVTQFTDFSDFVMSVSWSSDSSMLAVATVNGDIKILQVQ